MRSEKAKFSWVTFATVLGICLAVGFPIVSRTSLLLLEFRNNSITLVSASLVLSIVSGYWRSIWSVLSKVWLPIAKWVARKYMENSIKEYGSQIKILGLTDNSGTVNLILEAGANDGVSLGMMLTVVAEPAGEVYGEVQVTQIDSSTCKVSPVNRINTKFWENLEDRMKYDPSSPPNIMAKRQIPDGMVEFLKTWL